MTLGLRVNLAGLMAASLISACTLEARLEGSDPPVRGSTASPIPLSSEAPEAAEPFAGLTTASASQPPTPFASPTRTPPATYLTVPPEWLTPGPTSTPSATPIPRITPPGSTLSVDLPPGEIVFTRSVTMNPDDPSPAGLACHIFVMNSDGTGVGDLTPASWACNTSPAYSPDGALIAYIEGRRSTGNTIWAMNPDGSNVHQLSSRGYFQTYGPLVWSKDGMQIAIHFPGDFVWHIHALTGGQEGATLDELSVDEWHLRNVSPDGRLQAVYCYPDPEYPTAAALCLADRSTGSQVVLATPPISPGSHMASWSPDGRWILVGGSEGRCWAVRSDGSQIQEISQCFSPMWHP